MANQTTGRIEDDQLKAQFRALFDEVMKSLTQVTDMRETDPEQAAQKISQNLQNLIELQTLESKRDGNRFALECIADARYLKAALADEILLNTDWLGRERWTGHLLEASLFRTSIAGERVFEQIEQVLSSREPAMRPIAALYLYTLALGFEGKFRGLQDSERFFGYKKELFQFVYQRRADVSGRDRVLTEQAYGYTLSHIEPRKMVSISRWTAGIIITFLALLAISQILWLWQSWPLREALETGASAAGVSK